MRIHRGIQVAAAALLFSAAARAQIETSLTPAGGANWTATAGRTVGDGNSALHVEAGWPGIGFTYLKGVNDLTDVGFRVGFNYGFEGTTNTVVGLDLAVPVRRTLATAGDTSVALRADPGVVFYGNNNSNMRGALFGVGGPIGLVAGWRIDPRLTLDIGADVPVLITFTNPTGVLFGPQAGAGGEYLLDPDVAVTLRARVGPEYTIANSGTASQMGFTTLVGIAYNTR